VSDFGDVEMRRNLVAVGQVETRRSGRLRPQKRLEVAEFHNDQRIYLSENIAR
jgi:hypothetical protein